MSKEFDNPPNSPCFSDLSIPNTSDEDMEEKEKLIKKCEKEKKMLEDWFDFEKDQYSDEYTTNIARILTNDTARHILKKKNYHVMRLFFKKDDFYFSTKCHDNIYNFNNTHKSVLRKRLKLYYPTPGFERVKAMCNEHGLDLYFIEMFKFCN